MTDDPLIPSRRRALKCMAYGGAGTLFALSGGVFTPFDLALAADKSSAAITDTNPTLDVPCGPRQRSTRSVVDNIIIIPWKEPSQSRAIFLVLKASCGLMTSADVSTCVMTEEDKLAPILSVDRERIDEAGRRVCGSRIEGGFRE